ncbi:hypothetical protein ACIBCD_17970 [Nocardia brasiliensis]|uniref:hypothetical protein n=1 Tax=Nocardia brasiliensis TaxID=37326 RepID=UPI003793B712
MAEYYKGRKFSSREELGLPPRSPERDAEVAAIWAEFNARREAVPLEKRIHLSSRFGDEDWNDDADWDDSTRYAPPAPPADEQGEDGR